MNIRCEQIDDLLLEGDAFSIAAAQRHAETCDACREQIDAWLDISSTAHSMRTDWQNDMLWPRIERSLKEEKRRARKSWVWQVAAAAVLTVSIGATSWYVVRDGSRDARFDAEILRVTALDDVERAEQEHVDAIRRLETMAAPTLEQPDAPIMISYKEKLMMLDDAIAECEENIRRNRLNAHVRKQLLAMYSEKQRTLQDVLREGTHGSNQ